jgi:hypothetical protein
LRYEKLWKNNEEKVGRSDNSLLKDFLECAHAGSFGDLSGPLTTYYLPTQDE